MAKEVVLFVITAILWVLGFPVIIWFALTLIDAFGGIPVHLIGGSGV